MGDFGRNLHDSGIPSIVVKVDLPVIIVADFACGSPIYYVVFNTINLKPPLGLVEI